MKVYIAGKVTNATKNQINKFETTAEFLKQHGHDVINCMAIVPAKTKRIDAMKILLPLLMECDAIYLLRTWSESPGAMLERALALYCGLQIINEGDI